MMQPSTSALIPSAPLVVVTREAAASATLSAALMNYGYAVQHYPVLRIAPPADGGKELEQALAQSWDWLVLTSGNAVRSLQGRWPRGAQIAVVGPMTAALVAEFRGKVQLIASAGDAESLLAELSPRLHPGARVLLPQADNARPLLVDGLRASGAELRVVTAYVSQAQVPALQPPWEQVAAVTFASSATVERFCNAVGQEVLAKLRQRQVLWAAIGRHTRASCEARGLLPLCSAEQPLPEALAAAVAQGLGAKPR